MKQKLLVELFPMPHETLKNHWRVPVQYVNPDYIVFIGQKFTRTFNEKTIPSNILAKLTMARASDKEYSSDNAIGYLDVFYYSHNDSMSDVAWRVSDTIYIVVLEERELRSLFGKENGDTRS